MFYVEHSQHFNQSDFGVLFPHLTRRFAKAEEPERILELNTRAMVEVMREAGIEVASEADEDILRTDSKIRSWMAVPLKNARATAVVENGLDTASENLVPVQPSEVRDNIAVTA